MQAEKSPAFSFYAKEWIADTREFPPDIRGALSDLMAFCWVNGSVPDNATGVATLVGIPLERLQEQNGCWWSALRSKFGILPDRPGRMFCLRLEVEREKQEEKRAQASEAGKLSAEARARKRVNAKFNGRSTVVGTDAATDGQRESNLAVASAVAGGSLEPPIPAQPAAAAAAGSGGTQEQPTDVPRKGVRAARTKAAPKATAKATADKPPLPFRAGEACAEVQKYAKGRFMAPDPLDGGHAIIIEKAIRRYGDLRQWAEMGKWFAAGGPPDRRGLVDIGIFVKMVGGWFPFVEDWCKKGRHPVEQAARPAFTREPPPSPRAPIPAFVSRPRADDGPETEEERRRLREELTRQAEAEAAAAKGAA